MQPAKKQPTARTDAPRLRVVGLDEPEAPADETSDFAGPAPAGEAGDFDEQASAGEAGDFDEQAPAGGANDIAELLTAWNDATLRLEHTHAVLQTEVTRLSNELEIKNQELARKNRLADLGQMASHVAHEVRNNLVPVNLYLSLLRRRLSEQSECLDILSHVEAGFTALDATVNDLLSFTAHRQPQWRSFLVCSLVEEVCESMAPQLEAQDIAIDIDVPPNTVLTADREMIRRAVLNLVLNAMDVMPSGGELVITGYDGVRQFELEVADSGPGLSNEQKRRLFEPFYTTKDKGTGLGLSVVFHVAESHGGKVTAINCPEGGAAFTLKIPRRAMEAAA
ncbi:Sporulation kinase A [Posidoniimonas polymericola]|uniref:histidine kinase n=1 Tax=Posidoniimonas polymericola TaxID=2528002 RepID=A0A5C5YQK1_9BACT|nr:HAMP domain-containing sensor histidine kinase [Posidoniimonas polymericola]TWT77211.1 Sporulation kinase A [Posidoniimonas polymericola]